MQRIQFLINLLTEKPPPPNNSSYWNNASSGYGQPNGQGLQSSQNYSQTNGYHEQVGNSD